MKKFLSLVLALVMVLGLSVPAFAGAKTTISEVNLTVGKTYTDLDTGVSVSVPDEADYTASYGGMEFVVGSDVYFYQITGGDANRWLKGSSLCQTEPDVSNADKVFAVINLYTKDWQTYAFAENDELTVTCNGRTINHKAQAESKEGWFSVGGISNQVLIDITPPKTSGSTVITANVAKPDVVYEIVIPQAVTMNEAGVKEIGAAKIDTTGDKLKYATANTVISYTASGTNFTLKDGNATMAATYYTDSEGKTALTDNAIVVYKDNALVSSLTTLYVGVSKTDWDAAATSNPGTYTATVTYNFKAEEVEKVTIADILPDDFPETYANSYWRDPVCRLFVTEGSLIAQYEDLSKSVPITTVLTPAGDSYTCTVSGVTWTFTMAEESWNSSITISGITGNAEELNGTYGEVA